MRKRKEKERGGGVWKWGELIIAIFLLREGSGLGSISSMFKWGKNEVWKIQMVSFFAVGNSIKIRVASVFCLSISLPTVVPRVP